MHKSKLIKEKKYKVKFIYVKGHSRDKENNEADRLASSSLEKPDIEEEIDILVPVIKKRKTIKDYFK